MIIVNRSGGGGVDFYQQDGSLTSDRTVAHSGFTLTFDGATEVISPSASSSSTSFGVKIFGGADYAFQVLGNNVVQVKQSSTRMFRLSTNDYTLGLDGNGYIVYSTPKINGVLTGHRFGRVDGSGNFTQIGIIESNDTYNSFRFISVNGQVVNLMNLQDHNGNIRLGYNPQTGGFTLFVPTGESGVAVGDVYMDTAANIAANNDLNLAVKQA